MAGGGREEKVAERFRKPASGTVVDGVGAVGGHRGNPEDRSGNRRVRGLTPARALEGHRTPREVLSAERHWAEMSG